MIRARTALFCAVLCDAVVLLGALPLANYSIAAARSPETSVSQLLLLLLANLALLALCLCGAAGWVYAAARVGRKRLQALWAAIAGRTKFTRDMLH